jgi:hypothetical protein
LQQVSQMAALSLLVVSIPTQSSDSSGHLRSLHLHMPSVDITCMASQKEDQQLDGTQKDA